MADVIDVIDVIDAAIDVNTDTDTDEEPILISL